MLGFFMRTMKTQIRLSVHRLIRVFIGYISEDTFFHVLAEIPIASFRSSDVHYTKRGQSTRKEQRHRSVCSSVCEALLMSTHNIIIFHREIRENIYLIPLLSLAMLLCTIMRLF